MLNLSDFPVHTLPDWLNPNFYSTSHLYYYNYFIHCGLARERVVLLNIFWLTCLLESGDQLMIINKCQLDAECIIIKPLRYIYVHKQTKYFAMLVIGKIHKPFPKPYLAHLSKLPKHPYILALHCYIITSLRSSQVASKYI